MSVSGAWIPCTCGHLPPEHGPNGKCRAKSASGWPCDCTSLDLEDHEPDSDVRHGSPIDDQVKHDTSTTQPDCACGPEVQPVQRDDGSMGWVIVHHSLDGREQTEPSA